MINNQQGGEQSPPILREEYKMGFDIFLDNGFKFEITENYESDKWHIVIYQTSENNPSEHVDTRGLKTEKEVFDLIKLYIQES